jgi:bacillolysin
MKNISTVALLLFLLAVWNPTVAQSLLNKYQKVPPGSAQQTVKPGLAAGSVSSPTLLQNLNNYIAKIGLQKTTVKLLPATLQTTAAAAAYAGGNAVLSLPSVTTPSAGGIARIVVDAQSGTPRFIEMVSASGSLAAKTMSAAEKETAAMKFLAANAAVLNIADPSNEFAVTETRTDDLHFTSVRFAQRYKGLDVWGKDFIVHIDPSGKLVSAGGNIEKTPVIIQDVAGIVTSARAVELTLKDMAGKTVIAPVPAEAARVLAYTGPAAHKVIWHDQFHIPHLVWVVEARSGLSQDWFTFIDANTGAVLNSYNAVCYDGVASGTGTDLNGVARTLKTYQIGANYFMIDATQPMFKAAQSTLPDSPVGAIVNLDVRNADLSSSVSVYYVTSANNTWSDASSVSSHYNAAVTYKYFLDTYNRNSVDDKGMTIYSVLHVTESGKPMENAFWSGNLMCYGDGATYFKPLAGGLDVAAHEMTHGVTQFSANLEYLGQSGALNESMSDAFGTLVDTLNWTMGEKIIKNLQAFPSGALRNLADPHNGAAKGAQSWQPAKMSEYLTTTDDNGGVHLNSGIPNRAFYLTATTSGRVKAGKIWYRALTVYLTRSSQFVDARIATVKAAADLYGSTSPEVTSVKNAWDAVEVFDTPATPPPPATAPTGAEWILSVNTDPADANTIYMAKTTIATNADFFPLSRTPVLNRPSVSDVSGLVLFVDGDNNLRALNANPTDPQETVIDKSGVWESVSIGPGLNSLALTSKFIDTTIYYFDLVKNTSAAFKIATKTFDAADVKTALYADALSFDPTGRYLLFDTYNELKNATGAKLSYWNINILDVTTGNMGLIFPPLAEGLSVGNPSFSKTLSTRFAFDYINDKTGQVYVMAADFNTGDVGTVAGPQTYIGYPSYSANDKAIVYHTSVVAAGVEHHSIEQMLLKSNLIDGVGTASPYLVDAMYPSWFVIGKRATDVGSSAKVVPTEFNLLQNFPNPFNPSTTIRFALPKEEKVRLAIYDMLGNLVTELINGSRSAGDHEVVWSGADDRGMRAASGMYILSIEAGSKVQTRKMVLLK